MGNIVHRNNALKDKMVASNVLMGLGNDSTDTVEKRIRDLEEGGGGGGGSVVVVTPLLDEGVHIADISVNGRVSELYAPDGGGGDVTDVQIDGTSILDQDGVANIETMTGATSQANGEGGLVPAPAIADKDKFLKGNGTWADASNVGALNDLSDVDAQSPSDGDALVYDGTNQKWTNGQAGEENLVNDVVMNGSSIVTNKVVSFNNYVELTQAEYDVLPSTKLTDGIMYCIKDASVTPFTFLAGTVAPSNSDGVNGNQYILYSGTTVQNIYYKINNVWIPLLTNGDIVSY